MTMNTHSDGTAAQDGDNHTDVHNKLGQLTRQLHDTMRELGVADRLRDAAQELPDAKSRLTYIARLTGEAAEKVLNRVDQARQQQDHLIAETRRVKELMQANPVAAVSKGHLMNYLNDVQSCSENMNGHLTEIMMAQDFHDLTGQVIARVVNLASALEEQLVQLLIQTAPVGTAQVSKPTATSKPATMDTTELAGPVVDTKGNPDRVPDQSQVDDLLASLGF
jgi:chemotaxis protein CheZ